MPDFMFTSTAAYAFKPGMIFLGRDPANGRDCGIRLEKHGIVVATTRTGKGAGFIIPNLKRWQDSTVVIDPKGENCAETWRARLAMGQTIALIDPFGEAAKAGVPEWSRALFKTSFNPLEGIEPYTPRARERLAGIANALTVVHDKTHMEWVEGCRSIIAGVCAYTIAMVPPEHRHLGTVRGLLNQTDETLSAAARDMLKCDACGGLAKAAGGIILKAIQSDKGLPHQLLDKAKAATEWLDSPELAGCLMRSDFSLSDLTKNKLSVYLVLNADDLETYSGFLRLFIQSLLRGITDSGVHQKTNCLFILDEFYSLGKFDKIAEVMGRMAGYGVHVVPIVQNVGQLQELYGRDTTTTFFGNAEFEMFFGDGDPITLQYISTKIGNFTVNDMPAAPPPLPSLTLSEPKGWTFCPVVDADGKQLKHFFGLFDTGIMRKNEELIVEYKVNSDQYNREMRFVGSQRLPPPALTKLIGKPVGEDIARSMIVFAKSGDILNLKLAPFFLEKDYQTELETRKKEEKSKQEEQRSEVKLEPRKSITLKSEYRPENEQKPLRACEALSRFAKPD